MRGNRQPPEDSPIRSLKPRRETTLPPVQLLQRGLILRLPQEDPWKVQEAIPLPGQGWTALQVSQGPPIPPEEQGHAEGKMVPYRLPGVQRHRGMLEADGQPSLGIQILPILPQPHSHHRRLPPHKKIQPRHEKIPPDEKRMLMHLRRPV